MRCSAVVCSILPPYILRHLAERGDTEARAIAHATLETSAYIRGERGATTGIATLLTVSPGEKRRTVYDARHQRILPGERVRGEGEPRSRDLAVDEAYDGSGKTYDFFADVFGRNSIDDAGMRLDATVHYGVRFANAQWNGRQMVYGDGDGRIFNRFTKAVDVIAHELTHGITQHTAGLAYHDQPGALNEHFSDVFGALVKQHSLKQKAGEADWLIGAGLFARRIHGDAVRSMKAPGSAYDDPLLGKDPQPAHMRDYVPGEDDNGGVHVNSGIPNRAFYLAATSLDGFAWESAGRIWYRTLTRRLEPESSFAACAEATVDVARELFGARSAPERAVADGWKAVGIGVSAQAPRRGTRVPVRRTEGIEVATGGAEWPSVLPRTEE